MICDSKFSLSLLMRLGDVVCVIVFDNVVEIHICLPYICSGRSRRPWRNEK